MGYIETYIDPENKRGYFESWVAVVDKDQSKKFQDLVTNSEKIIPMLPWPSSMEKDKFLAPDFTTLEVICFAANGCPLGINIPNYDEIRENEGFKNVYLGNAMPKMNPSNMQFATPEQAKKICDNVIRFYQVHVACHELLGHGTGKSLYRNPDGTAHSFTDPLTGETYESCYEEGDTWGSRFGAISASYEECRADTCGYFLCQLESVYSLFGIKEHEVNDLLWVNVMQQLRKGIIGLQFYNADSKKWGQAHTQGAYVITQWLYRNQQSKIVDFEILGDNDFRIHLNEENLLKEGKELISKLLVVLQTYKSSGAADKATKFYNDYSEVNEFFLKIRTIVMNNRKPRRLTLNNNLLRYNSDNIVVQEYPEVHEGLIMSFADRYPWSKDLYSQVMQEWAKYKDGMRV